MIFLPPFDSFLFCLESYGDSRIAGQWRDELLIARCFIKAPCCARTWHFLPLNLQRTDTNALMSFKRVYKLGRVCGPPALKKGKPDVQVLTDAAWKRAEGSAPVCLCELTPDFKKCMKNTAFFLFSTQRKRANGSKNARGKHSSNNVRAKGADQRESCLQFRPTRQFFRRLPGERAQREINLRYQFADFCSIDGRAPGDVTLSAQGQGPINKIT